jgi:adenylate kinase
MAIKETESRQKDAVAWQNEADRQAYLAALRAEVTAVAEVKAREVATRRAADLKSRKRVEQSEAEKSKQWRLLVVAAAARKERAEAARVEAAALEELEVKEMELIEAAKRLSLSTFVLEMQRQRL